MPVKVIVPYGPGSTPDLVARIMSEQLGKRLGQPFVVENKSGAAGNLGTMAVAQAKPDGHTVGVGTSGPMAANTVLYKKLPYDPLKEIVPVSIMATQPCIVVATDKIEGATMPLVLDALKKDPGKYNYSSMGVGSLAHLVMQLVAARSGSDIVHLSYRSSADAIGSLLGGHTQLACMPAGTVLGQIKAGKLRALAVSSGKRSTLMPEIPTLAEAGLGNVQADPWIGMFAPAGTPQPVIARLHSEITLILKTPQVIEQLKNLHFETVGSTPEEMAAALANDLATWKPIIEKYKITIE